MNTKFLKQGLFLLLLTALFAVASIYFTGSGQNRVFSGENVFARSIQNLSDIGDITIETPLANITLVLQDNLWRIREEDNYYAAYNLVNNLFSAFNTSLYFRRRIEVSEEDVTKYMLDDRGVRITVKDTQGQILNSVLIGAKTSNGLYRFAKVDNEPGVFLITGNYTLPKKLTSWIQQPLLSLSPDEISDFTVGKITASRPDVILPFKISGTDKQVNLSRFLNLLGYVNIIEAKNAADFNESLWPASKKVIITSFDGMIAEFDIFTNQAESEYWCRVKFSTTTLPTTAISDYIKNNAFLYNGWYFKLSPEIGRILFNAVVQ